MVAQIDEQHAAMVADAMAPAGQPDLLADVALAERAAGMGAVTVHSISKGSVEREKWRTTTWAASICQAAAGSRQIGADLHIHSRQDATMKNGKRAGPRTPLIPA